MWISKKRIVYLFPVLLVFAFFSISWNYNTKKIKAKKAISYLDNKPDVYWFNIRVQIDERNNTFKMVGATGGVSYGQQISFEKALWHGLSRRQIAVGPFLSKQIALNAKNFYKANKSKIKQKYIDKESGQIHWFAITFEESPRLRIFVLKRAPGAVASGNINFFVSTFFQLLQVKQVAIGPFSDYTQAELAKRLYRMNE